MVILRLEITQISRINWRYSIEKYQVWISDADDNGVGDVSANNGDGDDDDDGRANHRCIIVCSPCIW